MDLIKYTNTQTLLKLAIPDLPVISNYCQVLRKCTLPSWSGGSKDPHCHVLKCGYKWHITEPPEVTMFQAMGSATCFLLHLSIWCISSMMGSILQEM